MSSLIAGSALYRPVRCSSGEPLGMPGLRLPFGPEPIEVGVQEEDERVVERVVRVREGAADVEVRASVRPADVAVEDAEVGRVLDVRV